MRAREPWRSRRHRARSGSRDFGTARQRDRPPSDLPRPLILLGGSPPRHRSEPAGSVAQRGRSAAQESSSGRLSRRTLIGRSREQCTRPRATATDSTGDGGSDTTEARCHGLSWSGLHTAMCRMYRLHTPVRARTSRRPAKADCSAGGRLSVQRWSRLHAPVCSATAPVQRDVAPMCSATAPVGRALGHAIMVRRAPERQEDEPWTRHSIS